MSRHLVRSFLLATAFSLFVDAGPCRPHPTSALSRSESLTQTVSSSLVSSSVVLVDTETLSHLDSVSADATDSTAGSTDTAVTTAGIDTSVATTTSEPTSTMIDTFTSTTEAASDTTLTSSDTGALTTATSGDLTTGMNTSTSEATSTDNAAMETITTATETTAVSSTTAEPEPVCVDNSPTEMVCGAEGRPGNQCMHKVFSSRVRGFEACKEACKTNNCDSFSYRDENDECEAYQGRVGGTDGLSPRKWYDVACFNDENTPTDPEPQCVNNVLQPSPEDSACGAMGYPTSESWEDIVSTTATSVQECRDACYNKAGCDSFRIEEGLSCYLVNGKIGSTDGSTTYEVWYDMSCFCGLEAQPNNPADG